MTGPGGQGGGRHAPFTKEMLRRRPIPVLAQAMPHLGVCLGPGPCNQGSAVSFSRDHADLSTEGPAELPLAPKVTAYSPPLQDKEVTEILATSGNVVTLTVIPTVIYEHMVKK